KHDRPGTWQNCNGLTLSGHTGAIMPLLCWDQFLLSCSLDQTIKVWAAMESWKLEAWQ
ncbi:Os04g0572700, partial [Oryza sativa Japonica Group]